MTRQIGRKLSQKVAEKERTKQSQNPIAHALGKIEGIEQIRAAVEEDRSVIDQMRAAMQSLYNRVNDMEREQVALPYIVNDIQGLIYEYAKQRAVSLRVMKAVADGPRSFLVAGAARTYTMDQLVEMTEEFSVNYDFVYAFIVLAERYGTPQPEGTGVEVMLEDPTPESEALAEGA